MQLSDEQRRRAYRLLEEKINRMSRDGYFRDRLKRYNIILDKLSKGEEFTDSEMEVLEDVL